MTTDPCCKELKEDREVCQCFVCWRESVALGNLGLCLYHQHRLILPCSLQQCSSTECIHHSLCWNNLPLPGSLPLIFGCQSAILTFLTSLPPSQLWVLITQWNPPLLLQPEHAHSWNMLPREVVASQLWRFLKNTEMWHWSHSFVVEFMLGLDDLGRAFPI